MPKFNGWQISTKKAQEYDGKGWLCHRCIQCIGIDGDGDCVGCFAEPDPETPEFGGGMRSPIPVWECEDFLGIE